MFAVRRPKKTRYMAARAILRSGMINVTQDRVPGSTKGGMYAILFKDGRVWVSETNNFNQMVIDTRKGNNGPDCLTQAKQRGEPVDLYVLTKPELFCGATIREELAQADLLASRKARDLTGPGKLYAIRHHTTHDYFVVEDRTNNAESTILSNFLTRLTKVKGNCRNKGLGLFITEQAEDILNGRNFTIMEVDTFNDPEDAWLKRQVYIDDCKYGSNLNWNSVD